MKARPVPLLKTLWKKPKIPVREFICPLCHRKRHLNRRLRPGSWRHIVQIGLTTFVFTGLCWPLFHEKGFISFIIFWMIFEFIYRWITRAMLICQSCGFDPYLFLSNPSSATQEVERHWRSKYAEKGIPYPEKKPSSPRRHPPQEFLSTPK